MARGMWVVRVALFIAVAGTVWGMTVMVSSASGIDVSLPPATAWTGAWAATPHSGGRTFQRETLRQIVPTSVAGSVARVRFSNEFGTRPLVLADVHIAQDASGSSVDPASDRVVRFGGRTTTTIPPGASVTSDPIAFTVRPRSDVAVSVYLPQATGPATEGPTSRNTYVAQGDASGRVTLTDAGTVDGYYFLTNLDVCMITR